MRDIPIIMSGPMVLATLREVRTPGTGKTETRRLANVLRRRADVLYGEYALMPSPWRKVQPGDRLWVRESLAYKLGMWWYAADESRALVAPGKQHDALDWVENYSHDRAPSIHMPRVLSRLTLIVTAVKMHQLQRIRRSEIVAEGIESGSPIEFSTLWDRLHGPHAWDYNPEVVAITFRPVLQNIDAVAKEAA